MPHALMTPVAGGRRLSLDVPGLAEARPSVRRGDSVYATAPWAGGIAGGKKAGKGKKKGGGAGGAGVEWQGTVVEVFRVRFLSCCCVPGIPHSPAKNTGREPLRTACATPSC